MGDDMHARRRIREVPDEHRGRPLRGRDQERRTRSERRVLAPPLHDVGAGERWLCVEAASAQRGIGLAAAMATIRTRQRHRRTREPQVVDRDPPRPTQRLKRGDDALPCVKEVVDVDQRYAKRRGDGADEIVPRLAVATDELEPPPRAVAWIFVDLPEVSGRSRDAVSPSVAQCFGQRPHVSLDAATVIVDHVQDARRRPGHQHPRQRGLAQRPQRVDGHEGADDVGKVRMPKREPGVVACIGLLACSSLRERAGFVARIVLVAGGPAVALRSLRDAADDERIVGQCVAPVGTQRANAEVGLRGPQGGEARIESAQRAQCLPAHVQAGSGSDRRVGIGRGCGFGDGRQRRPGVRAHGPGLVAAQPRERADSTHVGKRRCGRDARIGRRTADERLEPARCGDHPGIDQHDVCVGPGDRAIGGSGKCGFERPRQHRNTAQSPLRETFDQSAGRLILRRRVDEQQPEVAIRVCEHGFDAAAQAIRESAGIDDDVDARRRPCPGHSGRIRSQARRIRSHGSTSHQRTD